jgi:hypothetical protein
MYEQQPNYSSHQQDNIRPQSHNSQPPNHSQQNRNNGRQAQEEASIKKAAAETKYFWNLVAKSNQRKLQNLGDGNYELSDDKKLQNKKRAEMLLFGSSADATHDIPQGVFQDVPLGVVPDVDETDSEDKDPVVVERSGAGEENIPTLENFGELKDENKYDIPSFIIDNIALMKYETPTPIQKHSIPLGIAGFDLMCCAQTVRCTHRLNMLNCVYEAVK